MKKAVVILALLSLFGLGADPAPGSDCAGAKVAWLAHDPAAAAAREKNLPLVLYFRRDGCRFCEMLQKNGFEREDIACYINRRFVAALIDTNRQPDLKKKYRIAGEPTVWFLDPSGKEIDYFLGYVPPERLSLILRYVGDGAYRQMTFAEFERRENQKGGNPK